MSPPGRRMDSPKGAGMDACAALCVPSVLVRSLAFACRAHGRHPFVPSGLSPVAHCTVHRPQCPIRHAVRTLVLPVPLPGQRRPCWCANQHFLSTPLVRRVCVANAATASNKSPPISWQPPRGRFLRRIASAPARRSFSTPRRRESPSWPPAPRSNAAKGILVA